jgi:hypothetical protein
VKSLRPFTSHLFTVWAIYGLPILSHFLKRDSLNFDTQHDGQRLIYKYCLLFSCQQRITPLLPNFSLNLEKFCSALSKQEGGLLLYVLFL